MMGGAFSVVYNFFEGDFFGIIFMDFHFSRGGFFGGKFL